MKLIVVIVSMRGVQEVYDNWNLSNSGMRQLRSDRQ